MGEGKALPAAPCPRPCVIWFLCRSRYHRPTGTWLQRALVLEELTTALRNTNFTCVSVDTEQVALYHVIPAQLWVRKHGGESCRVGAGPRGLSDGAEVE